ncbi:glycoside hydrolase family 127 protein [Bacteroides caecigallinarum]|uniref:glycoside hydrolase family 127 protein n=1 Tax=Bacteroides caecigallinarum TaxID=1411144 RepID=UPI00195DD4BA|nr:glycoside hydrolase family 127 protein [Bacteroides caecigallinarum]MBM6960709.1 glycoside hydrolase family 127 protein [Bacteroides caecigallinarum]
MKGKILTIALSLLTLQTVNSQSVYPGMFESEQKINAGIEYPVKCFNLNDVRLLPSRFKENMDRDSVWMVSIDVNRLLHSFRTTAGVFAGREGGYMTVEKLGGWESLDCELRGHITGHILSAYSLMYAATGSEVFKLKGDSLVNGLSEVQKVYGTGYLSAFPEELINRNIRGTSVWAPWYTLHKILSGLIDQYLYSGNSQALNLAQGMANWAYAKLHNLDDGVRRKMIRNEFGGINESFYNLYALTGNDDYRWLATFFYHNDVIDPLKKRIDDLGTKHTNTFIPKVLAEARNYELTGDIASKNLSEFFWKTMIDKHTFAPGCSSDKEHFFDTNRFSEHISGYTGETCCTYNMLKLSKHLFCWNATSDIADYYERALYNHILGQQDPKTGMVAYFLPLKTGSHKVYSTPFNSFWCCVGSGFESHAKYAESIYFHNDKGVFVNLFIPSVLSWKEKNVEITQLTDFPYKDEVHFKIATEEPSPFTVYLRHPSWSKNVDVKINGKKIRVRTNSNGYIEIERTWKSGDEIFVKYHMDLHWEYTPDNKNIAALLYGPVVLAGKLGTEGMKAPAPYSNPKLYNDYYTYDYNIPENIENKAIVKSIKPERSFVKKGDGLKFISDKGVELEPLFDVHRQRYAVYWKIEE